MPEPLELQIAASQTIFDRLSFKTAIKDQAGIAEDLAIGKDVPEIYGLSEAGFFDDYFFFLEELGFMSYFMALDPKASSRPTTIRVPAVILIYLMRIVAGLAFFAHIEPVILQSQALMRLVGFNGTEILFGTSRRGIKKPAVEPEAAAEPLSQDPKPVEKSGGSKVRGPFCADSIATYIAAISVTALEKLFNGVISLLASKGYFPKVVNATLDASEIQSTELCEGCGMVKKEKAPELRLRKGRIKKVFERVFGFKIWVVWDPASSLPIAMRFATIETADLTLAKEVITQAVANLGSHVRLNSIAFDRGFTDGALWWWLHDVMKIIFYVPAKSNMAVYQDAKASIDTGIRQTREQTRNTGHGKNKKSEVDRWDVVGVEGLTSAGFYGPQGSGSHENAKTFVANPINAVVVVHDPFVKNNPNCDTMVILTNDSVKKPLGAYDRYDRRSNMENSLFREAKQAWFIQRPGKNTKGAFCAHAYLTLTIMALTNVFQVWLAEQEEKGRQGVETGIRKFRETVRVENSNKVIVFDEGRYAIFDAYEVIILCGRTVLKPRGVLETITKEDILRKYGAQLE
jgi:Transposase DDE domain